MKDVKRVINNLYPNYLRKIRSVVNANELYMKIRSVVNANQTIVSFHFFLLGCAPMCPG